MSNENKKTELIDEFKKSITYLANLIFKKDKKEQNNIALNKEIEQIIKIN